jgi:ComF family protein
MVLLPRLLSLLAPDRCAACDEPIGPQVVFCPACASTVERADDETAPFVYGGALATAITRFKYKPIPELGRSLGQLLAHQATKRGLRADFVVPVPLHRSRLVMRGFNQSALLARPVAAALGAVFRPRALARARATSPQAELDRTKRLRNVVGAFHLREHLSGTVLLVDDVRTTGATQDECARVFLEGGCPNVGCLVLAIAPESAYP